MSDSSSKLVTNRRSRLRLILLALLVPLLYVTHRVMTCYPFGASGAYETSPGEIFLVHTHPYSSRTKLSVQKWNWLTNQSELRGEFSAFRRFSFLCDGRRLVCLDFPDVQRLTVRDLVSLRELSTWTMQDPSRPLPAYLMGLSKNGRYLVVHLAGTFDKLQVMDAASGAVTQELGFAIPGLGSHMRCTPIDCILVASEIDRSRQIPIRIPSSFEEGRFEPIGPQTAEQVACFRRDLGIQIESLGREEHIDYFIRNVATNATTPIRRVPHAEFLDLRADGKAIAFRNGIYGIEVWNAESNSLSKFSTFGERARLAAFTSDLKHLIGVTDVGSSYVWDLDTGVLRAQHRPFRWRHVWLAGTIALLGGWSLAWIRLRDRRAPLGWRCCDIVLLSGLLLFAFFSKFVEGGQMGDYFRISAVGSVALVMGLSALIGICVVFGNFHEVTRLSLGIISLACIWLPFLYAWQDYADYFGFELFFGTLMIVAGVVAEGAVLRTWGYRIVGRETLDRPVPRGIRFSTRDVFYLVTAVSVGMMVVRLVPLPRTLPFWAIGFGFVLSATQATIVLAAMRLVLSERLAVRHVLLFLCLTVTLAFAAPIPYRSLSMLPIGWYGILQVAVGLYVLMAMWIIRAGGFRLRRLPCELRS